MQQHEEFFDVESFMKDFYQSGKEFLVFFDEKRKAPLRKKTTFSSSQGKKDDRETFYYQDQSQGEDKISSQEEQLSLFKNSFDLVKPSILFSEGSAGSAKVQTKIESKYETSKQLSLMDMIGH